MKALTKLAFVVLVVVIAACSNFGRGSKPAATSAPASTPAPAATPAPTTTTPAPAAKAEPVETFFKVTDVSSGKVFYTRKVTRSGAAITFKEERTGADTSLQNSQVLEIQREAYMTGLAAQVIAPAAAVPAAAPSPAPATSELAPTTVPVAAPAGK